MTVRVTLRAYLVTADGRTDSLRSVNEFQLAITSNSDASELLAALREGLKLPVASAAPTGFDGCKDVRFKKESKKVCFFEKVKYDEDDDDDVAAKGKDDGASDDDDDSDEDSDLENDLDADKPWFETRAKSPVLSVIREGIMVAAQVCGFELPCDPGHPAVVDLCASRRCRALSQANR